MSIHIYTQTLCNLRYEFDKGYFYVSSFVGEQVGCGDSHSVFLSDTGVVSTCGTYRMFYNIVFTWLFYVLYNIVGCF